MLSITRMLLSDSVNSSLVSTVTDSSLQLLETSAPQDLILSSGFCGDYTQTYTYKHKFKKLKKKTFFSLSLFYILSIASSGCEMWVFHGCPKGTRGWQHSPPLHSHVGSEAAHGYMVANEDATGSRLSARTLDPSCDLTGH